MIWLGVCFGVMVGACSVGCAWLVYLRPRTIYKVCGKCFSRTAADDSVVDGIFDDK